MIRVKYCKYYNDYNYSNEVCNFKSLDELAEWMFEVSSSESRYPYFANPDSENRLRSDGSLNLDHSCLQAFDGRYTYWVDYIETEDKKIIYSDGHHTNGICHWNEEVKEWFRKNYERKKHPVYNFG